MHALTITPSIEVTIGRETRLYHAFITTAPTTFDAPATVTLHTGAALGRVGHGRGSDRARRHTRKSTGPARARGRHRAGLAARAIPRRAASLRAGRPSARRTEHAAALAVEPDRFADGGSRTRKRIAAMNTRPGHRGRATSRRDIMNIEVKILRNERPTPAGKLADAEIHFIGGELAGLKLVGFAVWERRDGNGRSVTFPSRRSHTAKPRSFRLASSPPMKWISRPRAFQRASIRSLRRILTSIFMASLQ